MAASTFQTRTGVQTFAAASGAGYLRSLLVVNVSSSDRWLHVFDNTAASGTYLLARVLLKANGGSFSLENLSTPLDAKLSDRLLPFGTGLFIASSDTLAYHASGSNDFDITVETV